MQTIELFTAAGISPRMDLAMGIMSDPKMANSLVQLKVSH